MRSIFSIFCTSRRLCQVVGASILILFTHDIFAHEDLDLGVAHVTLNSSCHVKITLKNLGHTLPNSFYQTVHPTFVVIKKGQQEEYLQAVNVLDKQQALKNAGGAITIVSASAFANNPAPIHVEIVFGDEFGDYGAGNNKMVEAMDCVVGKGQTQGEAIVYHQPDVAITNAFVDPKDCLLNVELTNLTAVPLDAQAWEKDSGVALTFLNLDTDTLGHSIALVTLDSEKRFGTKTQTLKWQGSVPFEGAHSIRLALWRVLGDLDFSNNTVELGVPSACAYPF